MVEEFRIIKKNRSTFGIQVNDEWARSLSVGFIYCKVCKEPYNLPMFFCTSEKKFICKDCLLNRRPVGSFEKGVSLFNNQANCEHGFHCIKFISNSKGEVVRDIRGLE